MIYYYDSKGRRYKGKLHVCSVCKREKVVRARKMHALCRKCSYGNRRTDIKDDELFITEGNGARASRTRAVKTTCSICKREYLRRSNNKFKTKICNQCICNHNGKLSYKHGMGGYPEKAFEYLGRVCSICQTIENVEVHHKDFDRTNNEIENLQVLCRSCHKKAHWKARKKDSEWMKSFVANRSGENGPSRLTNEQVLEIRKLYPSISHRKLAEKYEVGGTTILNIIHRRTWKNI